MEIDIEDTAKEIDEERIRHHAYMLWLEDGQPEGKADEHWHRASDAASVKETASQPKSSKKKVS